MVDTDYSNLQKIRAGLHGQELTERSVPEYIAMYETDDLLSPENLNRLEGTAKAAKKNRKKAVRTFGLGRVETDDTHYRTFSYKLDSIGAEVERVASGTKLSHSSSDTGMVTCASGDDITLEMANPNGSANKIIYDFEDDVPEELTDLDKAIVGYSWQFFDETRGHKMRRKTSEFVDSIISAID